MRRSFVFRRYGSLSLLECLLAIANSDPTAAQSCQLSATPASPIAVATSATLTATCTPAPTVVSWTSCLATCGSATYDSCFGIATASCYFPCIGSASVTVTPTYGGCFLGGAATYQMQVKQAPTQYVGLSTTSYDFGAQQVGTSSSTLAITVTNISGTTLTALGTGISNPIDFSYTSNCNLAPLSPGASCQVTVRFNPSSSGQRTAQLTVYVGSTAVGLVNLSGSGQNSTGALQQLTQSQFSSQTAGLPSIVEPFDEYSLGIKSSPFQLVNGIYSGSISIDSGLWCTQGATPTKCMDQGVADGTFTNFPAGTKYWATSLYYACSNSTMQVVVQGNSGALQTSTHGESFLAFYDPLGLSSIRFSKAQNSCNYGFDNVTTVGSLVIPGRLQLPSSLNFGSVNVGQHSSPQVVTLTNSGGAPVTISNIASNDPAEYSISNQACAGTLNPSLSCQFNVTFSPTLSGSRSSTISVVSSGEGSPQAIGVSGLGVAGTTPSTASAIEYYHSQFNHYFVTSDANEIQKLDNGTFVGWARTGKSFNVYTQTGIGFADVCRFFSTSFAPKSSHFYTPFASECTTVKANTNWQFEGSVFSVQIPDTSGVCPSNTSPVYRLYNNGQGGAPNHRYTTDPAIRSQMIAAGWIPEGNGLGVTMCSPGASVVGPGAITVTLPNIASVTFPAGSLGGSASPVITTSSDGLVSGLFAETASIFRTGQRLAYEVRINAGSVRPSTSSVSVSLTVPDAFLAAVPAGQQIEAFVLLRDAGGEETYDSFDLIPSTYSATNKQINLSIPGQAFVNFLTSDHTFEAVVTLAPTPGVNRALAALSSYVMKSGATTACQASAISCPVSGGCLVTSHFQELRSVPSGVEVHPGIDIKAATGTSILAAEDGCVEKSYTSVNGLGETMVIRHTNGSATLYAHLQTRSLTGPGERGNGCTSVPKLSVKKGDPIGVSDNTGNSKGPHLHFEYVPSGEIILSKNRIDPEACFGSAGSIEIGDNGTAADDAFSATLDGFFLGETAVGAQSVPLAINNLIPGTHVLAITCTVAPDDDGTLGIVLKDGLTFADGSTTLSENMHQGETKTYSVIAPGKP
ncbi:MAG: choice-of-anchor D domain-containing protein [Burkholderiales bacterium]